jgi:hypothetical protein
MTGSRHRASSEQYTPAAAHLISVDLLALDCVLLILVVKLATRYPQSAE